MDYVYTKKVMRYFKHPKNMGVIKNPDGVGKVGNLICLLPHQKIHLNNELKEINKISRYSKVLSHNGLYNIVDKVIERNYNGKIVTIENKLGKVSLTPDHLILAIKIPPGNKFLRTKYRKKLFYSWYHIDQLKKGDIVLYPILKEQKNVENIKINIPKSKRDFRSKEIPNKIPLNSDLLKLFGYFLAEGNIQDKPSRTFISFTLNIKENEIVEDIKKISKKLFGLDIVTRKIQERKTIVVYLFSAKLARFFKKLFGNGAKNKSIPDFIMSLPVEKQKYLIYGLWKGGGYVNINRIGPRGGYSTISYTLAQQIKELLLRQRIVPSIYKEKEKEVEGVRHKEAYRIHVGQRHSLMKLCSILNIKYKPRSYASEKAWFDHNFLFVPITRIKSQKYNGKVYNLEVRDQHSFTSEAFCLHNCGDMMFLYIKIKKNKKGKDIISDVKFQTFGCVAAVATSSMITELVKGKTIEQALKITREDIANALGGLPKIKLHCSVLAADAFSEAVYDYLSKNKLPIPKQLLDAHERIQKETEMAEKHHREYIALEKKILETGKK